MKTQHKTGWTLIESVVVLAIVGLLALVMLACWRKESVEMPEAYRAWTKQTGNPKELTYEEWRSLVRANERQNDTTFIYVQH